MADSFTCPHCQRAYPALPKLIGRPVRCTGCKQAFRLGEDLVARPVAAGSSTAQIERAANASGPRQPEASSPPPPSSGPDPARTSPSADEAATSRQELQERLRQRLRAATETAARHTTSHLSAVESEDEEEDDARGRRGRPSSRRTSQVSTAMRRRPSSAGRTDSTFETVQVAAAKPIVPRWLLATLLILGVGIAAGVWWLQRPGPIERGLIEAAAPIADEHYASSSRRIEAYYQRYWLRQLAEETPVDIITNCHQAGIGRGFEIPAATLTAVLGERFGSRTLDRQLCLWHHPERGAELRTAWAAQADPTDRRRFLEAVRAIDPDVIPYEDMRTTLRELGLDQDSAFALECILLGEPGGSDPQAALLADGGPARLHWFGGDDGKWLQRLGSDLQVTLDNAYWGLLMQPTPDSRWRVLAMRIGPYDPGRISDPASSLAATALERLRLRNQQILRERQRLVERLLQGDSQVDIEAIPYDLDAVPRAAD